MTEKKTQNPQALEKKPEKQLTASERFTNEVMRQFEAEAGMPAAFSDYERTLAQHLFLKIDSMLKEFEAKRLQSRNNEKAPYIWENINLRKLAPDAVHRIKLGLDALIPNHIHPIPYFNGKEGKYDLDLRVGYRGKHYYRVMNALEKPLDVRYELVYSNDKFKPIMKSFNNEIESYEFEITNPFDRGHVIGGFGYIMFEDPRKNKLVIVSKKDFDKSMNLAQSKDFWTKFPEQMMYKTLVHRVTDHLQIDPKSVNAPAYAYVEAQDNDFVMESAIVNAEIKANANREVIDTEYEVLNDPQPEQVPEKAPEKSKSSKKQETKKEEPGQTTLMDSEDDIKPPWETE